MAGRQAKVITPAQLEILLQHIRGRRDAARSRVIILLSLRAGLRAAEIAKLEWPMVFDATGKVGQTIELEDRIAKKKHGRRIPIHPELRSALVKLHLGKFTDGPVIRSRKGVREPKIQTRWLNKWEATGSNAMAPDQRYCTYASESSIDTALERVCRPKRANLPRLCLYSFRHRGTSVLRASKVTKEQIDYQLGHRQSGARST